MMRKLIAATIFAASLVAGAAHAQEKEKLILGFPAAPLTVQFAYLAFGEELGFFRDANIQLEYSMVTGSAVLLPQVAIGRVHIGYANPDFAVIAAAKNEPLPITFVMNWARSHGFEFAVLEKSPLRTLSDLKGKKLGVGAMTWGNLPLSRAMLASAGVVWSKDVEILPVGVGPAAWRRLETGEVDALNLFISQHGAMELAGIAIRRLPLPDPYRSIFSNGWVANNDFIAKRPELIVGFGRALTQSWLACKHNVEACVKSHWRRYPIEAPQPGKEAEQLKIDMKRALFDGKLHDDFTPGDPKLYGHYPDGAWARMIDAMHAEGQITQKVDAAKFFTNKFVDDFNRFDAAAVQRAADAAKK